MHARKLRHLEERFDWYAAGIEADPVSRAGRWADKWLPGAREVRLDLGCGKGRFASSMAAAEPDVLFVGLDYERRCIALAAQKAVEGELANLVFSLADADDLAKIFSPGELSCIYLNYSSPMPRAKHAARRLTHADRLMTYRDLLAEGGRVIFRTDSPPLFEWSLAQFELAGYELDWVSRDMRGQMPEAAPHLAETEFEHDLVKRGATVMGLGAHLGERPEEPLVQTVPQGLVSYLPEDLESLEYIPLGMEDTVMNLLNRRANLERAGKGSAARGDAAGKADAQ